MLTYQDFILKAKITCNSLNHFLCLSLWGNDSTQRNESYRWLLWTGCWTVRHWEYIIVALSQLYITICRTGYTICLLPITVLKTINCFLTSKGLFFKKHIQKGNKDSKHSEYAEHPGIAAGVVPGTRDTRSGCWSCLTRDSTPGLPCPSACWSCSAGSCSRQQHHQRQHLTCMMGVCEAFLGSSQAFKVRKFVAEKEGKEAECRDRGSGCGAIPEAQPHFPAWPGDQQ